MRDACEKFLGKAVVLDPNTGETIGAETYVCVLLTVPGRRPGVTVCEAPAIDVLISKLEADDARTRFRRAKPTFEPPMGDFPICRSSARQRYEALTRDEIRRVQARLAAA